MNILSVKDLAKIGRETTLFSGVTFGLNEGDKAALIGKNGSGKSTLLRILAGTLEADAGDVVLNKESGISFLPQQPTFEASDTIRAHIFKGASPKLSIIRDYEDVCLKMQAGVTDALQKEYESLNALMEAKNLWNYEAEVRSVLTTLGIKSLDLRMGNLSGGMVKKVALAQVLVEDTALLLLDEPTNHLDIETITWLQQHLAETKRSVLMVTHDRYFLDAVCNHIYELDRARVKLYVGNYSAYLEKKQIEAQIEANTERRIESVLRFERDWLRRGPCARGTKAKARIQHDMALINRERFRTEKGFTFQVEGRRLGGKVLELHNISKEFPKGCVGAGKTVPVITHFSYTFNKGEKIGIFGNNGSGKSTLLNIICGRIFPDTGNIVMGQNTVISYYEQNPQFTALDISVLDYTKEVAEVVKMNDGTTLSASLFLERFGFTGKIQRAPLSSLSGGERKRLFLVRLLLSNPNFLILDEPTNDFDIFTMNILEQFLLDFGGCLLVVSHDRYFMDKICDTLFIMEDDGSISGYVGKCSEYIQYRALLEREEALSRKSARSGTKVVQPSAAAGTGEKKHKLSYNEMREFESLEGTIAALEEEKALLETEMSGTDYAKVAKASARYEEVSARLTTAYERWEVLAEFA